MWSASRILERRRATRASSSLVLSDSDRRNSPRLGFLSGRVVRLLGAGDTHRPGEEGVLRLPLLGLADLRELHQDAPAEARGSGEKRDPEERPSPPHCEKARDSAARSLPY